MLSAPQRNERAFERALITRYARRRQTTVRERMSQQRGTERRRDEARAVFVATACRSITVVAPSLTATRCVRVSTASRCRRATGRLYGRESHGNGDKMTATSTTQNGDAHCSHCFTTRASG